jgi:hypothetical protein
MEKKSDTATSTDGEDEVMSGDDEFDTDVMGKNGDSPDEPDVMGEGEKKHEHEHDHMHDHKHDEMHNH